jgi:GNAT superfamily N-acetyltransferase
MSVRTAKPSDAAAIVALYSEAFEEARVSYRRELVDWVIQAILHDPLRGLFVLAEPAAGGSPVGFAAFETSASAVHGWSGRLACLYLVPASRGKGAGRWLLGEALEFARYFGLNHVVASRPEGTGALPKILGWAGFQGHSETVFEIELPPLYDEV